MEVEPKLPDPMIDPQKVADAILDAASHHRRDVKVGFNAHVHTLMSKIAPGFAERMSARQIDEQRSDEPPRRPEGTLDQPGNAGRARGRRHGKNGTKHAAH